MDGNGREVYVVEKERHLFFGGDVLGAEAEGGGAAFQGVESDGVGFDGVLFLDVLTNVPDVVVGMFATGVGKLVGVGVKIINVFQILGAVVGLDFETFDGFPDELLLVVGAFEVFVNRFFPFFGRNRRKFGKQFVVFHCIMCVLYILVKIQRYIKNKIFADG